MVAIGLGLASLGLTSCGTTGAPSVEYLGAVGGQRLEQKSSNPLIGPAYWDGDHVAGAPSMEVDLRSQQARFYKGRTLVGVSPISSGTEGRQTPAGNYKILQKNANHFSSMYGIIVDRRTGQTVNDDATPRSPVPPGCVYEPAPMPHFMRLTWDGVGMHEGFLPGYPASHGCIRMDKEMARVFFSNVELGTPVRVIR
ncbi:hypothetical protein BH23VER1_BH23VER1_09480 [soil metagenome]